MYIKYRLVFWVVVALALAGVSCKSAAPPAPPAESPPAVVSPSPPARPAGPSQASLDALQKAAARMEEARKRASDFESPSYFPSDWEAAEAQRGAAAGLPTGADAEIQAAVAAHNAAADTYDGLFNKAISLYARAREDEIIAARDELIATGVSDSFPEYLREVDDTAVSALNLYEQKDYYAARDTAAQALGMYQTLKLAADAWAARQEIVDRNFDARDSASFSRADEIGLAAVDAYTGGDIDSARKGAEDALRRYTQVLTAGWAAYANDMSAAARKARQDALDLKANVAVKDTFNEGDEVYRQAAIALNARHYQDAAGLYTRSEALFVVAGQSAAEKRRIAEQAIREAERKIEASDEAARQAEIILRGGSI